jgi:hypothetical protein
VGEIKAFVFLTSVFDGITGQLKDAAFYPTKK